MVVLITGRGGGVEPLDVPGGTTVGDLVAVVAPGHDVADFDARVNRRPAAPGQVLRPGDRVSLTPARGGAAE